MKRAFFTSILIAVVSLNAQGQEVFVERKRENIEISEDSTFARRVDVYLKKNTKPFIYPIFYDSELERVMDIQLHVKRNKRFKPNKNIIVGEEDVELEYIGSKKMKTILIPPEVETKISYTINCDELIYLSSLPFFSSHTIDTLVYQIKFPPTFRFVHNTIYKDSLDTFSIDEGKSNGSNIWTIKTTPKKIEPNPFSFFGIYKDFRAPLMRTAFIPVSNGINEVDYMNNWYLRKLGTKRGLDSKAKQKIDELTKDISDPEKIIEILYNYVRRNFKYVAIEIGMGAFVPSHTNEVFNFKQGDCKDLSNFLSEALNYKGIQCHIALAATFDHISDCDFPSLSSANHVVCVAYIKDNPIILDPTDPIHIPGTPVESIQNRSLLMITPDGGRYLKAPSFSPQQNLITYELGLKALYEQKIITGDFETTYNGISSNFLKYKFRHKNRQQIETLGKKHYESIFGNQDISNLKILNDKKIIAAEGNLLVKDKIFDNGDSHFLFIDFLPRLLETEEKESLLNGTFLGSAFSKKVFVKISVDRPFEMFNPIEHSFSEKGIYLSLKIRSASNSIIECQYKYVLNHSMITEENIEAVNNSLKSFKKITNDPIVLKKKN